MVAASFLSHSILSGHLLLLNVSGDGLHGRKIASQQPRVAKCLSTLIVSGLLAVPLLSASDVCVCAYHLLWKDVARPKYVGLGSCMLLPSCAVLCLCGVSWMGAHMQ